MSFKQIMKRVKVTYNCQLIKHIDYTSDRFNTYSFKDIRSLDEIEIKIRK